MEADLPYVEKVTFLVGPQKEAIEVDKAQIAASSPAFNAMLFGVLAERTEPIVLAFDCPNTFRAMVEYMKTNTFTAQKFFIALGLCQMGNKYLMPNLVKDSLCYMYSNMDYRYCLYYYECLKYLGHQNGLVERARQMSCCHLEEIIENNGHLYSRIDTLIEIFSNDELNISTEMVLVDGLARYKDMHPNPSLYDGIRTALEQVRFLSIKPQIIMEDSNNSLSKLSDLMDLHDIQAKVLCPDREDIFLPPGFSLNRRSRKYFYANCSYLRTVVNNSTRFDIDKYTIGTAYLSNRRQVIVKGVILATATSCPPIPKLTVILTLHDEVGLLLFKGKYRLTNVSAVGRKIIFDDMSMLNAAKTFRLNMIVLNTIRTIGAYAILNFEGEVTINFTNGLDYTYDVPMHALLQGIIIEFS